MDEERVEAIAVLLHAVKLVLNTQLERRDASLQNFEIGFDASTACATLSRKAAQYAGPTRNWPLRATGVST